MASRREIEEIILKFTGDEKDAKRAAKEIGKELTDLDRKTRDTGSGFTRMGEHAVSAGKIAAAGVAAITAGVVYSFAKAGQTMAELDRLMHQTEAVIRSTGNAANVSAKEIADYAGEMESLTGVDDVVIQNAENMLLTFTNVRNELGAGNDVFRQASDAALDMSVALGEDMQASAMRLGKALNEPIEGVSALRRVGVQLSDEQENQIKQFMDVNDVMGAQKVILGELNKEFGGSAMAYGESASGSWARFKAAIEDVQITILNGLAPVVSDIARDINQWFQENQTEIQNTARELGENLGQKLQDFYTWTQTNGPEIKQVFKDIADAASTIYTSVKDMVTFLKDNWDDVEPILTALAVLYGGKKIGAIGAGGAPAGAGGAAGGAAAGAGAGWFAKTFGKMPKGASIWTIASSILASKGGDEMAARGLTPEQMRQQSMQTSTVDTTAAVKEFQKMQQQINLMTFDMKAKAGLMGPLGQQYLNNLATGMSAKQAYLKSVASTIGGSASDSLAGGMQSGSAFEKIKNAVKTVVNWAIQIFTGGEGFNFGSPSKKMFDIGVRASESLVLGMRAYDPSKIIGLVVNRMAGAFEGFGVARWMPTILQALMITGSPLSWAPGIAKRMMQESGGNPFAINLWDSNAAAGMPSQGLMQTIPGTFSAYHQPGTAWDIYNPLANIAAAINYIKSRYGSPYNLPVGGYAMGGDFIARKPYLFQAGERGAERVTVERLDGKGYQRNRGRAINIILPNVTNYASLKRAAERDARLQGAI